MTVFNLTSAPAAAVVATVTQAAAGAGRRNVCRNIAASVFNAVGLTYAPLVLRDGATGVGAILWRTDIAKDLEAFAIGDLLIIGTANTAMTLEFTVSGGGAENQTVALGGYVI